jgi:mono/diheme cytochrome c family protein
MNAHHCRRLIVSAALLLAAGCGNAPTPTASAAPAALQKASADMHLDGKELYRTRCGMCHQGIGMAVTLLSRRPGDTTKGLLENRKDLSVEFVVTAARTGIGNMPRIARGEVSDPELTAIADYLSGAKQ